MKPLNYVLNLSFEEILAQGRRLGDRYDLAEEEGSEEEIEVDICKYNDTYLPYLRSFIFCFPFTVNRAFCEEEGSKDEQINVDENSSRLIFPLLI